MSIDARQLSPSMDDYGMDNQHMDGLHGFEDAHAYPSVDNPSPNNASPDNASPEVVRPSTVKHDKAECCGGTGHLNQHYKAHLKERAQAVDGGARQTQITFDSDGSHQNTSYLSVVAHYSDIEHQLNKRVIGFRLMQSHTGSAIAEHILEVLQEFNL
ncbi:hypothetical protein GUJ93_ZPchr0001g32653 [Zizania palustris]|uniref:Uncharacterized protein n=1 Tax=Zizania palustris TaxID=103762 RepID=A0A8J5V9W9_ZIZPA|nr:hypothetical protein GUJ93_ZPchr0001g32653 [Zizania palustris]